MEHTIFYIFTYKATYFVCFQTDFCAQCSNICSPKLAYRVVYIYVKLHKTEYLVCLLTDFGVKYKLVIKIQCSID